MILFMWKGYEFCNVFFEGSSQFVVVHGMAITKTS